MADVFISYKREDKARVAGIAKALEEEGFSVWWDPEIPLGESYAESIRRELEAASTVLPIWSQLSVLSEWVQEEATLGKRKGSLVPARIDAVDPPVGFTMTQTADLCGWAGDRTHEEWRRLVEHVAENAKRPARAIPQGYKAPARPMRWGLIIGAGAVAAVVIGVVAALSIGAFSFNVQSGPDGSAATSITGAPAELAAVPELGAAMSFRGGTGVTAAAISADGLRVATGDSLGVIRVYNASNALPIATMQSQHTGGVTAMAYQASAGLIASAGGDLKVIVQSDEGAAQISIDSPGVALAFDALGNLIVATEAGEVIIQNVSRGGAGAPIALGARREGRLPDGAGARSLMLSPSGRELLVGGSAGWAYLFSDLSTLAEPRLLPLSGTSSVRAALSPDGRRMAAATYERVYLGPVQDWSMQSVLQVPGGSGRNSAFALSRDGRRAAVAIEEQRIYVWDLQSQRLIGRREVPGGATYLAFTPDGARLLGVAPDGDASLYDVPAQ